MLESQALQTGRSRWSLRMYAGIAVAIALLAATSLAQPARANAEPYWTAGEEWLEKEAEIELDGWLEASESIYHTSMACSVHIEADLFPWSGEGRINQFDFSQCYTFSNTCEDVKSVIGTYEEGKLGALPIAIRASEFWDAGRAFKIKSDKSIYFELESKKCGFDIGLVDTLELTPDSSANWTPFNSMELFMYDPYLGGDKVQAELEVTPAETYGLAGEEG